MPTSPASIVSLDRERAARVMPGGVLGTFALSEDQQFIVQRGLGSRVLDDQGREYIDFVMGSGPLILGHAHPAVVDAIQTQAALGTQYYTTNFPALALAERIIDAVPCAELVKFTSTGAEATFQALRLARAFTGRQKILRFAGAYHGHHDYGMVGSSAGIPDAINDVVVTAHFNDIDSVATLLETSGTEIAAVIVEPVQRIVSPRPLFLQKLREMCTDVGALLIFDEVVTGFRLSRGGAQGAYGIRPDIATLGKIIGGGLPLGAVAGREDILALANPRTQGASYVYFSGTLNGNPLSAAAGIATLDILEQDENYEALAALGRNVRARLAEIAATSPKPLQIFGEGAMVGIAFAEGDPFDPATLGHADKGALKWLEGELLKRGIFTHLAAKLYLSTTHDDSDIDGLCRAVQEALRSVE